MISRRPTDSVPATTGYSGRSALATTGYSGRSALATTGYSGRSALATTGYAGRSALATTGYSGRSALATTGYSGRSALATTGYAGRSALATTGYAGRSALASFSNAILRIDVATCSSRLISPQVLVSPSGMKMLSQPKPDTPLGSGAIAPQTSPEKQRSSRPSYHPKRTCASASRRS